MPVFPSHRACFMRSAGRQACKLLMRSIGACLLATALLGSRDASATDTVIQRIRPWPDLHSRAVEAPATPQESRFAAGDAPVSDLRSGQTLPAPPATPTAASQGTAEGSLQAQRMDLLVGDAAVVATKGMYRVSVGNARAIQVVAIDRSQLLLIGENPGFSKVHVWEQGGMRSMDVLVLSGALERIEREANAARDRDSALTVRREADRVVVSGPRLSAAERVRFADLSRKHPELSMLAHANSAEQMVVVDLFFVEVKTERVNQLGIRWSPGAQGPSASVSVDRLNPLRWTLGLASQFTSMLQFLQNDGDAVLLARPTLTSKIGGSARFVAGGELPIPVSSALGQGSVLFKEYGIRIDIAPTLAADDILNLRLTAEISSINFEAQVKDIPGIAKRRTESEVQVRSGDTLVVAGLISDDVAKSFERVPGVGDIPGIGGLFRSRQFRDRNSELLLFVAPRLVKPGTGATDATPAGVIPSRAGVSR